MRFWVGVTAAFGAGGILGVIAGIVMTEEKCRAEYKESAASYRRAMEAVRIDKMVGEVPAETEGALLEGGPVTEVDRGDNIVHLDGSGHIFSPETTAFTPAAVNPYHKAVEAIETPVEMFVDGGVNDYGVSYIEEEEFEEDDGRYKGRISMVMNEANVPTFFLDGTSIEDWDVRLGDSIIVDFNRHAIQHPGSATVLYVRNHKTDEDYEVVLELP